MGLAVGLSTHTTLREIDDGWDFKVLILENEWVLRIPRSDLSAEELVKETELLPVLAPALPVEIPRFERLSREPLFVVYRLIRGEPLRDEDSDGARAFLEALHSVDTTPLAVPRPDWCGIHREHADTWRSSVVPLLDREERIRGEALLEEIETLDGFEPALVHCDLGPSHLLCRDGRLAGVIDWADAKVGDPRGRLRVAPERAVSGLGRRRRAETPRADLSPARAVVRGRVRAADGAAGVRHERPRRRQVQTLTSR